jgi:hypothetical protein
LFSEEGTRVEKPSSGMLKKEYNVLQNMCQYCIFSRLGSMGKVNDNDLIYHLSKWIKLNLPYVIIQHMISTAKSGTKRIVIPYGILLTKIFQKLKVDSKKEHYEHVCQSFSLSKISIIYMKKEDATGE